MIPSLDPLSARSVLVTPLPSGKLARSWLIFRQAWSLLWTDKKLLVFPVLSGFFVLLVSTPAVIGIVMAILAATTNAPAGSSKSDHFVMPIWMWPILFIVYFLSYFVSSFFQSALFSCAMVKFEGGQPSVRDGLRAAAARAPQLAAWALVNATVGIALQFLQERLGWLGRLILGTLNIAWNIATFFVVPVLVFEGVGPFTAIKRSTEVIRKSWGESLVTQFGFSFVSTLIGVGIAVFCISLAVAVSILVNSPLPAAFFVLVMVAALVLLTIVSSAMKSLLVAATYRYTTTGQVAGPFHAATLEGLFKAKK